MEYKIISKRDIGDLVERVNILLKEGWELKGSHKVVVKYSSYHRARTEQVNSYEYSQTLIKRGEKGQ